MNEFRFIPNIWVSFLFQENECIGRTITIEGENLIALVNEHGKIGHILFEYAQNPNHIEFTDEKSNKFIDEYIDEDTDDEEDSYYPDEEIEIKKPNQNKKEMFFDNDKEMEFAQKLMNVWDDLLTDTQMFQGRPMN